MESPALVFKFVPDAMYWKASVSEHCHFYKAHRYTRHEDSLSFLLTLAFRISFLLERTRRASFSSCRAEISSPVTDFFLPSQALGAAVSHLACVRAHRQSCLPALPLESITEGRNEFFSGMWLQNIRCGSPGKKLIFILYLFRNCPLVGAKHQGTLVSHSCHPFPAAVSAIFVTEGHQAHLKMEIPYWKQGN